MPPTEIALVGCHNATELIGRCSTHPVLGEYIHPEAVGFEGLSAVQAYPILEGLLPVRFVDVLDNMPDKTNVFPNTSATVTFQSRLNQRVKCTIPNVSPETFRETVQDMVSSTLWYLNSVEEN